MWWMYVWQSAHFGIYFFTALVNLLLLWLYSDAWWQKRDFRGFARLLGYLLIAIGFGVLSAFVDDENVKRGVWEWGNVYVTGHWLKFIGLGFVFYSVLKEPSQPKPNTHELTKKMWKQQLQSSQGFAFPIFTFLAVQAANVALISGIGILYWLRATIGLEKHLRGAAIGWSVFMIAELLDLGRFMRGTNTVWIFEAAKSFGGLWVLHHLLLLASSIIFLRWIWQYLLKRIQVQLFFTFSLVVLSVFVVTTASFTGMVLKRLEADRLDYLEKSLALYEYALERHQQSMLAEVQWLGSQANNLKNLESISSSSIASIAGSLQALKLYSQITVIDEGNSIVWESSPYLYDISYSADPMVLRAMGGEFGVGVSVLPGGVTDAVVLMATAPIHIGDSQQVMVISQVMDRFLLENIKAGTALETAVYAGSHLTASTIPSDDGWYEPNDRFEKLILEILLEQGDSWTGAHRWQGDEYLLSMKPLKNRANVSVGALVVGEKQEHVLKIALEALRASFGVASLLMSAAIIPSYLIARKITVQLR